MYIYKFTKEVSYHEIVKIMCNLYKMSAEQCASTV